MFIIGIRNQMRIRQLWSRVREDGIVTRESRVGTPCRSRDVRHGKEIEWLIQQQAWTCSAFTRTTLGGNWELPSVTVIVCVCSREPHVQSTPLDRRMKRLLPTEIAYIYISHPYISLFSKKKNTLPFKSLGSSRQFCVFHENSLLFIKWIENW